MNKNKGFTLIEVIVAMLVFSIAMTGIVLFTATNSRRVIKSERGAKMSVRTEAAFENVKGWVMEETGNPNELVFDSLWENADTGHVVFVKSDTIKGMVINNRVEIDHFEFTKNSPRASGSRIWFNIISEEAGSGKIDTTQIACARHR